MAEVINSEWFTGVSLIGIVVTKNEVGQIKSYIGLGYGDNPQADEKRIAETGTPVMIDQIERTLRKMKGL
jgi:hypothetical protein